MEKIICYAMNKKRFDRINSKFKMKLQFCVRSFKRNSDDVIKARPLMFKAKSSHQNNVQR